MLGHSLERFSQTLFPVGDSNHNRMVITDFDGNAQHVTGSVDQGFSDGTY